MKLYHNVSICNANRGMTEQIEREYHTTKQVCREDKETMNREKEMET